jgi:hypothetical protein
MQAAINKAFYKRFLWSSLRWPTLVKESIWSKETSRRPARSDYLLPALRRCAGRPSSKKAFGAKKPRIDLLARTIFRCFVC